MTICNYGLIDKVMSMALLSQYRGYAEEQGIAGSNDLQFGQKLELEQKWVKKSYPGMNSNVQDFAKLLASLDIKKESSHLTLYM